MLTLEAFAFGLDELSHDLLPLALFDLGYVHLGLGLVKLFPY